MRGLLEKIEADAAKKLPLPPGRQPSQELARYRNFLKVQSHRLKILHRNGISGIEICQARAAVLDLIIRHLAQALHQVHATNWPPLALVAIGGYGRAELNPHSDIDIMFLVDDGALGREPHPCLALIGEGILMDIGLKPGHSTRSPSDCVHVANSDRQSMQTKTSLIEARLIYGEQRLFDQFQKELYKRCVKGFSADYIAARLADQEARHAKFGNSPMMQEPNIKNGCGGLRDYQNLLWMVYFKYGARTPTELVEKGMLLDAEARELAAAYDFLLRARTELHYQVPRPLDVLNKNLQPKVANFLGYKDRSPWVRLENFMRDYYKHSRNLYLITRTVEKRLALSPGKLPLLPALRQLLGRKSSGATMDGFKVQNDTLAAANPQIFDDSPRRMMRAFLHTQQRGMELHPDLIPLLRSKLSLVNREFLKDAHVRATFLEILSHHGNVGSTLRAMHEVGLLGKYVPEFGKLTNLVQHEFYHQYAADEHTLVCLEKLDQIWDGKAEPYSNFSEMLQSLENPLILNLALLLHDCGKIGHYHDHSEAGEKLARKVARRMELDASATHTLCFLIHHHLAMAEISQRRDLGDPAVISQFAALVQNERNLKYLTLLTVADTLGTSEKLWSGFKDTLLRMLYRKTLDFLQGTANSTQMAEKARDLLALELARQLPKQVSEEELYAHFKHLPLRYFEILSQKEILVDLELTHQFMAHATRELEDEANVLHPVVHWQHFPDRGYSEVKVCTWDRPRLFSRIAGTCSAAGLNILSAQVFTRADGIALDTFYVIEAATASVVGRERREQFESILNRALSRSSVNLHSLIAKQKVGHVLYQSLEGEKLPTKIQFDNQSSADRTVLEIITEDRMGLLYIVSQAMAELGLDVSLAKICTEKGAAIDTFYVTHCYEGKLASALLQDKVRAKLRSAILGLEQMG